MEMHNGGRENPQSSDDDIALTAHCTSPDRTVFTEPGNPEAWIATDHTVRCDD